MQSCIQAELYSISYLLPFKIAIFDTSQFHTLDSLRSSLVVSLDPEHMNVAAEISMLACIPAETLDVITTYD